MSHFMVMIVGDNPEAQLAPFQENNMCDCPKEYLVFDDYTEELKKKWKSICREKDNEFATFDEYAKSEYSWDEEKKAYGYWSNPNAQYDWYMIGGRWAGYLKLKKGAKGVLGDPGVFDDRTPRFDADQAYMKDIDWQGMKNARTKDAKKDWNDYLAKKTEIEGTCTDKADREQKLVSLRLELGLFDTIITTYDAFIKSSASISPFAVLYHGEWIEKGQMGWWGMTSNEKDQDTWDEEFQNILKKIKPDDLITIVDCHI